MKRYIAAVISTVFLFAIPACNNVEASVQNTTSNTEQTTQTLTESDFITEARKGMENATELTLDCAFGKMFGLYAGETKNGVPHGQGKFVSQNLNQSGWYYEGSFVDGHFEGEGKTAFQNGQVQEGNYVKDIWHPNTLQFFEFMQTLPGSDFTINEKAKAIFAGEKNYFPVQSMQELSGVIDNSASYNKMVNNIENYGDKFVSISDLSISTCSTFAITENPENLPELRGAYIEASNSKNENYALYYRGNIDGLKETSVIESAIGIPLGIMKKTDDSGTEKTYVVLAVSYVSLQETESE